MDERTLQKLNDSTFAPTIYDHVANGGSLIDLCKLLEIKYSRVIEWIYSDPLKAETYERAMKARGEWAIQSILNELKIIGLANLSEAYDPDGNLLPPSEWPPAISKSIQAVETTHDADGNTVTRVKLWDKLKALELLGKNFRLFKEQIEHTGQVTLEDLVLGSMLITPTTKEAAPCSINTTPLISQTPLPTIQPEDPLKVSDSSLNGKTVLSDDTPKVVSPAIPA